MKEKIFVLILILHKADELCYTCFDQRPKLTWISTENNVQIRCPVELNTYNLKNSEFLEEHPTNKNNNIYIQRWAGSFRASAQEPLPSDRAPRSQTDPPVLAGYLSDLQSAQANAYTLLKPRDTAPWEPGKTFEPWDQWQTGYIFLYLHRQAKGN